MVSGLSQTSAKEQPVLYKHQRPLTSQRKVAPTVPQAPGTAVALVCHHIANPTKAVTAAGLRDATIITTNVCPEVAVCRALRISRVLGRLCPASEVILITDAGCQDPGMMKPASPRRLRQSALDRLAHHMSVWHMLELTTAAYLVSDGSVQKLTHKPSLQRAARVTFTAAR